jgi:hypothetical protein
MDWTSDRLFNDKIIEMAGISSTSDNLSYRQWIQTKAPEDIYGNFVCGIETFTNKDESIRDTTNVLLSQTQNSN